MADIFVKGNVQSGPLAQSVERGADNTKVVSSRLTWTKFLFFSHLLTPPSVAESESNVQAYGIHADFSLGRHVYNEINDALQGLQVGILGQSKILHEFCYQLKL